MRKDLKGWGQERSHGVGWERSTPGREVQTLEARAGLARPSKEQTTVTEVGEGQQRSESLGCTGPGVKGGGDRPKDLRCWLLLCVRVGGFSVFQSSDEFF